MLNLDHINSRTASVFRTLAKFNSECGDPLSGMRLIGGTALAARIGHRNSLDLDFATNSMRLDANRISRLIKAISDDGISCVDVTDVGAADEFANDGLEISDYQQDWLIGDVKVQFFAYGQNDVERAALDGDVDFVDGIAISSIPVIAKTKAHVVCKRTKSRDLFDLLVLIKEGFVSIDSVLAEMQLANPHMSYELLRYRLAEKPILEDDEGISPVGVQISVEDIRRELGECLDDFETRAASEFSPK